MTSVEPCYIIGQGSKEPRNAVSFESINVSRYYYRYSYVVISLLFSFMLVSQVGIKAYATEHEELGINGNFIDRSSYHASLPKTVAPSTSTGELDVFLPATSLDGKGQNLLKEQDFTTQAALSLTKATQTSNIVSSKSYYDTSFRTSTSGVIKYIKMSFPAGTYVGASLLVEATGIGPGKISAGASGNTLAYTVTNAVNVPANTNIRIQIANVNNPPNPSSALTVSITTRDSANIIIDGPTSTNAYNIKQIGPTELADNAVTSSKIADGSIDSNDLDSTLIVSRLLLDDAQGASFGWDPNGLDTDFIIFDEAVEGSNAVLINVGDSDSNSQCESLGALTGFFTIRCNTAPPQGSELRYTITNIPTS